MDDSHRAISDRTTQIPMCGYQDLSVFAPCSPRSGSRIFSSGLLWISSQGKAALRRYICNMPQGQDSYLTPHSCATGEILHKFDQKWIMQNIVEKIFIAGLMGSSGSGSDHARLGFSAPDWNPS